MPKVLAWTALAAALLSPPVLFAATPTYPDRPIRFIVPLAPGGAVDLAAREIDKWGKVVRAAKLTVN